MTATKIYSCSAADRHTLDFPVDYVTVSKPFGRMAVRHYRSLRNHGLSRSQARHTIAAMLYVGTTATWHAR